MRERMRNIMRLLPVLLVVWLYSSTHFFMHTHQVNGVVIAHSHLGGSQHQHSASALQLIAWVTHSFSFLADISFWRAVGAFLLFGYLLIRQDKIYTVLHTVRSLRAPPATC